MAVYSALQPFIVQYGLFAVFVIITLESAGLQLQGDNFVFLAAIAGPLPWLVWVLSLLVCFSVGVWYAAMTASLKKMR